MSGAIAQAKLTVIVERLRVGSSSLITESKGLGFTHNGPLRAALKALLGVDGYNVLMVSKRPTTRTGVAVSAVERVRPDDSGLRMVMSTGKTDGWSWRYVSEHEPRAVEVLINKGTKEEGKAVIRDAGARILILIDPDGVEYVRALEYETAHLLRANPTSEKDPPVRLVRFEVSMIKKQIDKNTDRGEELLERGVEAREARKRNKGNGAVDEDGELTDTAIKSILMHGLDPEDDKPKKRKTPKATKPVKAPAPVKAKAKKTPTKPKKAVKGKKK